MISSGSEADEVSTGWAIHRAEKVVLFVDIVESVRLIETDEEGTIQRWLELVAHIDSTILPSANGRSVKSSGDGMLLEFDTVREAVQAGFKILKTNTSINGSLSDDRRIHLRIGIDADDVIIEKNDLYGRGVNLAARLMALAGRDEIVISAGARDQLTADLDADIEDLGECYLRHISDSVRAYRVGPPGVRQVVRSGLLRESLAPTIAVIPFKSLFGDIEQDVLGEILADESIAALSRHAELNVISRLSTTAFRNRELSQVEVLRHLNADYSVSGVYRCTHGEVLVDIELASAQTGKVIWSDRLREPIEDVLKGEQKLINELVKNIGRAIMSRELQMSRSQPLPTLKAYTLLMGAIALMHRLSHSDFERARQLLQTLLERNGNEPIPNAWLANWHVLRVQQGWSIDPKQDAYFALECTKRALDVDPDCDLALAIDGFVHTNLLKRFDVAQHHYNMAIDINPNNALAWLLRGTLHAFKGEGERAIEDTHKALQLSPLDPHSYFYDALAASACFAGGEFEQAVSLAQRSLKANRTHTSTLRVLGVSKWQLGQHEEAKAIGSELMKIEPGLTVSGWLMRAPSADFKIGTEFADLLRKIGVPE